MFDFSALSPSLRLLVLGDVMLDKVYRASLSRFASDAPVPVAKVFGRDASPGGAANVARCLASLGFNPTLAGFVGEDHNCESLMELLYTSRIDYSGLVFSSHPTTTKVRVISNDHQVFRLDFDDDTPYQDVLFLRLRDFIHNALNHSLDAIILADYEKGVCTERFCQEVIADAHCHGTPVIVLPYGSNWIKYQKADLIVANIAKINKVLLSPVDPADDDACSAAASYVCRKFNVTACAATRSAFGLTLSHAGLSHHCPTTRLLLVDPAGAADASVAAFSVALASGLHLTDAAAFSNLVAGVVVSKPGSYAPTLQEVQAAAS